MQLKTLFLAAAAATSALALPTFDFLSSFGGGSSGSGSSSSGAANRVPGYPYGNPSCLSDAQAAFLVKTFKSIMMNPNRTAAVATGQTLILDSYVETSDSINVLAGYPQGGPSFSGKKGFLDGVAVAPPIRTMTDLDIWHDCTKIGWQWVVDNLAMSKSPAKGFNKFTADPATGFLKTNELEFNSIAWGIDLGGTWIAPGPPPSK